jgi:hypothetical protein
LPGQPFAILIALATVCRKAADQVVGMNAVDKITGAVGMIGGVRFGDQVEYKVFWDLGDQEPEWVDRELVTEREA